MFSSILQVGKSCKKSFEQRLIKATVKNIKTAVLLTPGPVATHLTTRNMSTSFSLAIKKANFINAAKELEASGLGDLVILSRNSHVFIKKTPSIEVREVMRQPDNAVLCSMNEYIGRYNMPTPSHIKDNVVDILVDLHHVPREYFKRRPPKLNYDTKNR